MYDIAILGSGPAGAAAAINAQIRRRSFLLFGAEETSKKLKSAQRIENYPGMPDVSGEALASAFAGHLQLSGISVTEKKIDHIYPMGDYYALTSGDEMWEARVVILASGASPVSLLPGEEALMGRGVSYCATCDGALYRGGHVIVIAYDEQAAEEAAFLKTLASVTYVKALKSVPTPEGVEVVTDAKPLEIRSENRRVFVVTDKSEIEGDCVFIFRSAIAPNLLIPGLETENGSVKVSRDLSTNLPGVFAAGDVTGAPYQIAKAVGEGATAALSAVKYLAERFPDA